MVLQFYDNAYLRRLGQHKKEYSGNPWNYYGFRLLKLMDRIGMKAKALEEFLVVIDYLEMIRKINRQFSKAHFGRVRRNSVTPCYLPVIRRFCKI